MCCRTRNQRGRSFPAPCARVSTRPMGSGVNAGDRWISLEVDGGYSVDHFEEELRKVTPKPYLAITSMLRCSTSVATKSAQGAASWVSLS